MQPTFLVSRVGGTSGRAVLYRDYSHGSRTKFRSPRLRGYPTRRLPLPSNVRAALFGALRSLIITITSIFYGANFCFCRLDVSLRRRKRKEETTRSGTAKDQTGFAQFGRILHPAPLPMRSNERHDFKELT